MKKYAHQWKALVLMTLAWSFAGLVHNCVAFLFPSFSESFALTENHNGYLTATLAMCWTVAILTSDGIAKRFGKIKWMSLGLLGCSVALFLLGRTGSLAVFYALTGIAGFGAGTIVGPSLAFLAEQSNPAKRGMFFGIAMASYTLIGSAMGSVVFTRICASALGWRGAYTVLALLIFAAAAVIYLFGRGIPSGDDEQTEEKHSFAELLQYRNVLISTALACVVMMWYFTVATYTILYLMNSLAFSAVTAGAVFAGFGTGGFVGELCAPILSDRVGRKKTALAAAILGSISYSVFLLADLSPAGLTLTLALGSFFMSGTMAIVNSVVPSESVPEEMVSLVTSFTPAVGEFMGSVVAPVIAGTLTLVIPLGTIMHVLLAFPVLAAAGLFFLKETAPAVLARTAK